jgi:hypothetical protein
LFGEAATKYGLPFTPNALTLSKYKNQYLESIQAQFVDMGLGPSTFYGSLCLVYERFQEELEKPYQKNPLLIVISDGQIDDGSFDEVIRVTDQLKGLGVQVIHCYIGSRDIIQPKTFYASSNSAWPSEASRLFDLSSLLLDSVELMASIKEEAKAAGNWDIPQQARLFTQINQSEMLEGLIDVLLGALKD